LTAAAALPALPAVRAARPPVNKWLVTLSVTFGTLMGTIDTSIVNVAVSHLRGAVGATVEEITWVSTGFILATVVVMPLTGFFGRLFGQKRVYLASLAIFILGSALCGMARSLETLVAFRVIQGLGAGALQPTEQAILRQTFPPKEQGMAMAIFAMAVTVGPAIGPSLGGYIIDHYSWPWIFYINLPVGVLALFMVSSFVHEPEDVLAANRAAAEQQRKHMDWAGIAFLTVGMVSLQYVLEEGNQNDWFESPLITASAALAVVFGALFIVRELTATVPAVDLSLFRDKVFLSGTLIGGVTFAMLMALTFLLPVFMQEVLGFTATDSGLALVPRTIVMMLAMPIVGRLYNRVSPRIFVGAGVVLCSLSAYQMSLYTLDTSAQGVVLALIVQGVGLALLFVPLTTVALSSIPRYKLADASGSNSLIRQIGGSVGLAVFATALSRSGVTARAAVGANVTLLRPEVAERLRMLARGMQMRGMDPARAQEAAGRLLNGIVTQQATVIAFERIFLLAGLAFLLVIPLLFFLKAPELAEAGPKADVHVEI